MTVDLSTAMTLHRQGRHAEAAPMYEAALRLAPRDPEVLYLSPTVRLFGWPRRIEGVEKTLEFIGLTIEKCASIRYEAVESACLPDGTSSFVRVHFDWDQGDERLRSNYVVLYRYREGLIAQQELFYDPSGTLEKVPRPV